jgi:hypothetical protein
MNTADAAIENALSVVARSRDMRERALERRRELQRRTEVIITRPLYVRKMRKNKEVEHARFKRNRWTCSTSLFLRIFRT